MTLTHLKEKNVIHKEVVSATHNAPAVAHG